MWIQRDISAPLLESAATRPAVLLTGARQTGKTSLLKRLFPDHSYVTLDLPLQAEAANRDGLNFLSQFRLPVTIDEVQYAPELFRYLKIAIDNDRQKPGVFLIMGSQRFQLMQGVSESLAGRVAIVECLPLTALELERHYETKASGKQLHEWMYKGGYPEIYQADLDPSQFFSDYVATYLERDVRLLMKVKDLADFERLLRLLAQRTGQVLSYASLAADVGVSANTVRSWISILEASQVVYLLPPYFTNPNKRIIKSPKIYFHDTGLCCFLRGITLGNGEIPEPHRGAIFENFVFCQVYRSLQLQRKTRQLMFFRDRDGTEVDFVIEGDGRCRLIEVKWAENPKRNIKGFRVFEELLDPATIIEKRIVTSTREMVRIQDVTIGNPVDVF